MGAIDDLRIWSTARSADQILQVSSLPLLPLYLSLRLSMQALGPTQGTQTPQVEVGVSCESGRWRSVHGGQHPGPVHVQALLRRCIEHRPSAYQHIPGSCCTAVEGLMMSVIGHQTSILHCLEVSLRVVCRT